MGWQEHDAAVARLNEYVRGKTIVSVEYPTSLGETIKIEFTDGSSVTFDLDDRVEAMEAPEPDTHEITWQRIGAIERMRLCGYAVRELTTFQYRVNEVLDFFPKGTLGRFHYWPTDERGDFDDPLPVLARFFPAVAGL